MLVSPPRQSPCSNQRPERQLLQGQLLDRKDNDKNNFSGCSSGIPLGLGIRARYALGEQPLEIPDPVFTSSRMPNLTTEDGAMVEYMKID